MIGTNSLPPWPTPFPPPQQVDTEPGKAPAIPPTWPFPAGSGPAAAHRKQLKAPLSPSPGAPPQPGLTEGEPRSWRTHHPAVGNSPAAPRSPHAGSLSAWQNPPVPGPLSNLHGRPSLLSQSRQTDNPPAPRGCLGMRSQGGHRSSCSTVKTRDKLRAEATRPPPSSSARPKPVPALPSHVAVP